MIHFFKKYKKIIVIGIVIILIGSVITIKMWQPKKETTLKEYKVNGEVLEQTTDYKLYEFYGTSCPACDEMEATYQKVKGQYESIMNFEQVNVSKNYNLSNKYNVNVIPTFIIVDKEGNVKNRAVGMMEEEKFKSFIDAVLEK